MCLLSVVSRADGRSSIIIGAGHPMTQVAGLAYTSDQEVTYTVMHVRLGTAVI